MIPSPWIILGGLVVAIGLAIGGFFFGKDYADKAWKAEIAIQKVEEAAVLATATAEVSRLKDADVIFTRNLDEKHAAEIAVIAADRDDAAKRLAAGMRQWARRGSSCANPMPSGADHPASPADSAAGSEDRLYESAGSDLSTVGTNANKLASTVRECVVWANEHGRLQ